MVGVLIPVEYRSPDWYETRRPAVSASEIAVVMGLSRRESPRALYHRKRGEIPEEDDNIAMSLGRHLESWVADRFAEAHPEFTLMESGLYRHPERPWQLATPDRELIERTLCGSCDAGLPMNCACSSELVALWEGKTAGSPHEGWGDEGTADVPIEYRAQALWQMDVHGLPVVYLSCLFLSNRTVRHYVIDYDPDDCEVMRAAAEEFLKRVANDDPPPVDWLPSTRDALNHLHPDVEDREIEIPTELAERYALTRDEVKVAQQAKDLAENQIRELLGNARVAVAGGRKVASRSVYDMTGLDRDKLRREHPDAWAACKTTTTVHKLAPSRGKAA